jgi:hypothetical protein
MEGLKIWSWAEDRSLCLPLSPGPEIGVLKSYPKGSEKKKKRKSISIQRVVVVIVIVIVLHVSHKLDMTGVVTAAALLGYVCLDDE